jgi:hypothetical protein
LEYVGEGGETIRDQDFVESVENEKIENPSDDVAGGVVLVLAGPFWGQNGCFKNLFVCYTAYQKSTQTHGTTRLKFYQGLSDN